MSDKLNIEFAEPIYSKFDFKKYEIYVKPFLSLAEKMALIDQYLTILYDDSEENSITTRYLIAEYTLKVHIASLCTNIDATTLDWDGYLSSGLWGEIKSRIGNYDDFRSNLKEVIQLRDKEMQLEKSLGAVIQGLTDKAMVALDKLQGLDVEQLRGVVEQFTSELKKLDETAPGIVSGQPAPRKRNKNKTE